MSLAQYFNNLLSQRERQRAEREFRLQLYSTTNNRTEQQTKSKTVDKLDQALQTTEMVKVREFGCIQ